MYFGIFVVYRYPSICALSSMFTFAVELSELALKIAVLFDFIVPLVMFAFPLTEMCKALLVRLELIANLSIFGSVFSIVPPVMLRVPL